MTRRLKRLALVGGLLLSALLVAWSTMEREASAGPFKLHWGHEAPCLSPAGAAIDEEWGGHWYWMRSPDEEKRAISAMYNRYCIRCHGVDGRGVWDIPDVPDFTNPHWQACHTDGQLVRSIVEGRGAVMPPFRGTLSLDEAWAMARFLRTFVPGTEVSRPVIPPAPKTTGK
jgi:mono/diheme cytochrome c family protein